jgi:hypothetical protein
MADYTVEVTYKVRHLLKVGVDSPESALSFADELVSENTDWNDMKYDTLISEYTSIVKENVNAKV